MRVVLYGLDGVGKSTWGAGAPDPIFLGTEDGTSQLDVARFPEPKSLTHVREAIAELELSPHDYKTLVIDSLDWLEPLIWRHVCEIGKKDSIEDFGYGKGYVQCVEHWRGLLADIDALRIKRGMHVVMVAHAQQKKFQNPEGDDYDHYILKLHEKSAGLIREWSDAVLFAQFETHVVEDEKSGRAKGFSTGKRVMQTTKRAAYDAKNRYGLPQTLPLSWHSFADAIESADPKSVHDRCAVFLAAIIDVEKRKKGEDYLTKIKSDLHRLNEFENRLKEMTK
jgi:hypothetical protein